MPYRIWCSGNFYKIINEQTGAIVYRTKYLCNAENMLYFYNKIESFKK